MKTVVAAMLIAASLAVPATAHADDPVPPPPRCPSDVPQDQWPHPCRSCGSGLLSNRCILVNGDIPNDAASSTPPGAPTPAAP
jgi:hypothetical protein